MAEPMPNRRVRRFVAWLRFVLKAGRIARFLGYAGRRFLDDGCPRQAAGLSYVTLLAIVPMLAIVLAVLTGFPAFEDWRFNFQILVYENLMPDAGLEVSDQLTTFIEKASGLTAPGLLGLAVTVLLLMSNINGAFNAIWRVAEPRSLALRLTVYWTLLTLGPLLIGASISVSSYAFAAAQWFGDADIGIGVLRATRLLSFLLAVLGFGLLYLLVPNRSVHPAHALAGGFVAALLFELLKVGFGLYLRAFPSYQLVYGAISAVPIFLVWMYLCWAVVLFGAEIAAALPEWRAAQARGGVGAGTGARLALALSLIARLREASREGAKLRERRLGRGLPAAPADIDDTLRRLRRGGLVERALGGRWLLARDLEAVSLGDLSEMLDLGLAPGPGWPPAAEAVVGELAAAGRGALDRSLADLLARTERPADAGQGPRPELRVG